MEKRAEDSSEQTYIATFRIKNPGIFGHTIDEVQHVSPARFIISRLWHGKELLRPTSDTVLKQGQHKVQIGDNKNLVDWAYAGNIADAHILAADRLP